MTQTTQFELTEKEVKDLIKASPWGITRVRLIEAAILSKVAPVIEKMQQEIDRLNKIILNPKKCITCDAISLNGFDMCDNCNGHGILSDPKLKCSIGKCQNIVTANSEGRSYCSMHYSQVMNAYWHKNCMK